MEGTAGKFWGAKKRADQKAAEAAPKYGNDDDYVDELVVDAYNVYIDEMKKYHNTRYGRGPIGGIYYAGNPHLYQPMSPQGQAPWQRPMEGRRANRWRKVVARVMKLTRMADSSI